MSTLQPSEISEAIAINLPFLRRYARALTGAQSSGDAYAAATLETILERSELMEMASDPRVALFKAFHSIWQSSGANLTSEEVGLMAKAQQHLSSLTSGTREALLLHTIEEMDAKDVATVLDVSTTEAQALIDIAYEEMSKSLQGAVMIIEDEAIIALDLESIISEMGHRATGVARTKSGAVDLFKQERPDMILSDINLADGSSGIEAVNEILEHDGSLPVIFVTAYPERLLTGKGPEPAFLITKPYTEDQVRSAVSQAMFFASTETLKA